MTDVVLSEAREIRMTETGVDETLVRVSKLSVFTLLLSIFCVFAILTTNVMPVCWITAGLAIVALVRIARDRELTGAGFARWALALSVLFGAWSTTMASVEKQRLYNLAGNFAAEYLDVLAAGQTYEAMELRKEERDRQITGTNLEEYYSKSVEEGENYTLMVNMPATRMVMDLGTDANWELVRGRGIEHTGSITRVMVEMADTQSGEKIWLTMQRTMGVVLDNANSSLWQVKDHGLPGAE